jgi:hypothetical protein
MLPRKNVGWFIDFHSGLGRTRTSMHFSGIGMGMLIDDENQQAVAGS